MTTCTCATEGMCGRVRAGGMGGGGPYQPITRKQTLGIDPILFVVALVGGFLFLLANATKTGTIS